MNSATAALLIVSMGNGELGNWEKGKIKID